MDKGFRITVNQVAFGEQLDKVSTDGTGSNGTGRPQFIRFRPGKQKKRLTRLLKLFQPRLCIFLELLKSQYHNAVTFAKIYPNASPQQPT